jgi:hypothetical protein
LSIVGLRFKEDRGMEVMSGGMRLSHKGNFASECGERKDFWTSKMILKLNILDNGVQFIYCLSMYTAVVRFRALLKV